METTITIDNGSLSFSVCGKPSVTEKIISNSSTYPPQHTLSHEPTILPIKHKRRRKKRDNVLTVLHNSTYCYNARRMEMKNKRKKKENNKNISCSHTSRNKQAQLRKLLKYAGKNVFF